MDRSVSMKKMIRNTIIGLCITLLFGGLASYLWFSRDSQKEKQHADYNIVLVKIIDSLLTNDSSSVGAVLPKLTPKNQKIKLQDLAYKYTYQIAILLNDNQVDSIPFLSKKALDIADDFSNDDLSSKLFYQLGKYYRYINDYPASLDFSQRALALAHNNQDIQIDVYNNLGGLYFEMDELEKALKFFTKSYEIASQIDNKMRIAIAEGNIGNTYLMLGEYEKANSHLKKTLPYFEIKHDTIKTIKTLTSLSKLELFRKNYPLAIEYLNKAKDFSLSSKDQVLLGLVYQHFGNTFRESNELELAKDYYNKAFVISDQEEIPRDKLNALDGLGEVSIEEKDYKEAFNIKKEYYQLRDSVYGEKVRKKLEEVKWLNKLEEQRLENRMLKEKRIVEIQRNGSISALSLLVLVSIIIFSTLLYWNKKKSLKISILENDRLLEKIESEQRLKEIQEQQFKQDMEIKNQELIALNILILAKNKIFNEVENIIEMDVNDGAKIVTELRKKVKSNMDQEKDWDKFKTIFEQTHPTFYHTINEKYPILSKTEIRVCSYIKIAMPKTEICAMMNINHASLLKTRYCIRKKLNLESQDDLDDFIQSW